MTQTNNQLLELIANTDLDGLTNNQLLKLIADNGIGAPLTPQAAPTALDPVNASTEDIANYLNNLSDILENAGVLN